MQSPFFSGFVVKTSEVSDITETRVSDSWTQALSQKTQLGVGESLRVTKLTAGGAPRPARDQSEAALRGEDTR